MSIELLIVVLFCMVVQNMFGVGILVFGTPILLGLDYDLLEILGMLLPSSLLVSLLQVQTLKNAALPNSKSFVHSIFGVLLGAALLLFFTVPVFVYVLTAIAMLMAGCLRLNNNLRTSVGSLLARPWLKFYFWNGFFHGFSNLGGILLVLKNSLDTFDKRQALKNTASIYIIYMLSQIVVICLSGNYRLLFEGLVVAPIVATFSFVLGNRPLVFFSMQFMDNALGVFFVSVSAVLFYKVSLLI